MSEEARQIRPGTDAAANMNRSSRSTNTTTIDLVEVFGGDLALDMADSACHTGHGDGSIRVQQIRTSGGDTSPRPKFMCWTRAGQTVRTARRRTVICRSAFS